MIQIHLNDQQFYCLLRCDLYEKFDGVNVYICIYIYIFSQLVFIPYINKIASHNT